MKFEDAVAEAIRKYYDKDSMTELSPDLGNEKYTPKYFDTLEEELLTKPKGKKVKNEK